MTIPQAKLDAAFDAIYGINRKLSKEVIPDLIALGFMFFVVILLMATFGGGN